jgi:hypothetical protein
MKPALGLTLRSLLNEPMPYSYIVVRKHKGRLNSISRVTILGCCKLLVAARMEPLVTWTWFPPDPVVAIIDVENHMGEVVEEYV